MRIVGRRGKSLIIGPARNSKFQLLLHELAELGVLLDSFVVLNFRDFQPHFSGGNVDLDLIADFFIQQ